MSGSGNTASYNNDIDASTQNSFGHNVFEEHTSPQSVVGTFLANQFGRRHEDLRGMLDGNKDSAKLDAMKRIVGMVATGKDVSELFPAVVKNVVSKNIEIKKLVYVYLVRYAEEQQDLALLSIATFQRGLKDPNQLIRASALRVLSSIRVPVIVPIMMLSLKEAVSDMSPYVRKTAANAIPKLYCLDPEQKDALVEIIEKLLQDKTTLVAGSTVIAFEEVCPERIDLIHKNYRKLCNLLIDIDEWGQVAIINMLIRYARTQFLNPNQKEDQANGKEESFYPSSPSEGSDSEEEEKPKAYTMDADHRLLLKSCQPLLQSRNSAVVMAVAKLYHHTARDNEVGIVVKALVRLLRSHREVQSVVLSNIVTMSLQRKPSQLCNVINPLQDPLKNSGLFDSYIKSFFVHATDPSHVKKLKLEVLTNLASESNIPTILREFQTYVASSDKEVSAATIQAIGRCASNIPEVADTCLAGLIRMLSNRDENVVSESIIVVKKLLQTRHKDYSDVITHMAKLLDKVHVPMARASIVWLIGEYSDRVPKIAPDVLRKMAKTFTSEEDIVKLQVLNLGAKLYIVNSKQTRQLCQYVLQLAKYDQNYDIRDRARFLKFLLFPGEKNEGATNNLKKKAKKIFLVEKPAPVLQSLFKDRGEYQLGSLSHMIDAKANGYQELPSFPEEAPDPSVRKVEIEPVFGNQFLLVKGKNSAEEPNKSFYTSSEEESDGEEGSSSEEESDEEEEEENGVAGGESEEAEDSSEESGEESEFEELSSSEEENETSNENEDEASKTVEVTKVQGESSEEESSEEETSEEEDSYEESESEEEQPVKAPPPKKNKETKAKEKEIRRNQYDQLLDLDDFSAPPVTNGLTPALTPSLPSDMESLSLDPSSYTTIQSPTSAVNTRSYELLSKINGKGLNINYRFTRGPCPFSRTMINIELSFHNQSKLEIKHIKIGKKTCLSSTLVITMPQDLDSISILESLPANQTMTTYFGVDMNDTIQPVNFQISTETSSFQVCIKVPVGELIKGTTMNENEFTTQQKKLTGMTESTVMCTIKPSLMDNDQSLLDCVLQTAFMNRSPSPAPKDPDTKLYRFAGNLVSSGLPVLLTVTSASKSTITVNCEKISVGSLLAKEIKTALSN